MWYQAYFSYGLLKVYWIFFLSFHYFYFYSSRGKLFEVVLDEEAESGTFVDDVNDTFLTLKCHEILWKTLEPFPFILLVVVVVADFISTRIEE